MHLICLPEWLQFNSSPLSQVLQKIIGLSVADMKRLKKEAAGNPPLKRELAQVCWGDPYTNICSDLQGVSTCVVV